MDSASTDALGYSTHTYSDGRGRTVQVIAPLGPYLVYGYDELDRLTRVDQVNRDSDAIFATTTLTLDAAGRKTAMTDPDMGAWSYTYDALGNLLTQKDAKAQTIWMKYDALNRLLEKRVSSSTGTLLASYSYDLSGSANKGIGRRTGMSDASGSTAWEYDARGRIIDETKVVNGSGCYFTQWEYFSNDEIMRMVYPGGNNGQAGETINYGYNPQSMVKSITTSSGNLIPKVVYDEAGRVEKLNLGGDISTPIIQKEYTYNPWNEQGGRLKSISSAIETLTYAYDNNGNVTQIGDTRSTSYETLNFTYDSLNQLKTVNNAYSEKVIYDENGNISDRLMPDNSAGAIFEDDFSIKNNANWIWTNTIIAPYAMGNEQVVKSTSIRSSDPFDETGFKRSATIVESTKIQLQFKLDQIGTNARFFFGLSPKLPSTPGCDPEEPCEMSYSSVGNTKFQSDYGFLLTPFPTITKTLIYTYYNQAGLIEKDGIFYFFRRDTNGNETRTALLTNVQVNTWYSLTIYRGSGITSGPLTITVTQENDPTKTGTLTQTVSDIDWHFRHIVSYGTAYIDDYRETRGTVHYQYERSPHAVTSLSSGDQIIRQYIYDVNGNMITRIEGTDTFSFTYDTENHLVSGSRNNINLATYSYDGDGKRVKVVEGGDTKVYIGDYYEWCNDGTSTTEIKYYSVNGQRIAMRTNGTLTWLLSDHLGSTTIVANATGTLASEQKYTAWGTTRSGAVATDRQYTGQIYESQLGLYFYNARWYDPSLGRFISPDTIIPQPGNPLAWDRYVYVQNNPILYNDPSGHCYSKDSNGNLTTRCQAYWESYTKAIYTMLTSDAFFLASDWQGSDRSTSTSAYGKAAQERYLKILEKSGKERISTQELLSTVAFNEYGTLNGSDYSLAEEALGRQWYHWCGLDGICTGNQIWQFLGSLEGWYGGSTENIITGMSKNSGGPQRIYSTESWKNGPQSGRPFVFGNLIMYPNSRRAIIESGQGWGKENSVVLQVDIANPFLVWTPEQGEFWKNKENSSH